MGKRLRLWESQYIYSCVERTVDRQFLFKPDHRPDNRLLRWDSPADALEPSNDIIPRSSVINTIGAAFVRAQQKNPVEIYCCEGNVNHFHNSVGSVGDDLNALSKFKQHSNSLIARGLNKSIEREGHVFGAPFRGEPCLDDNAAEQKLFYAVTNVVKDGLVEKVKQSPFMSTYRHLAYGEPLEFWWIDWAGYWKAGGTDNKRLRVKDFLKWGSLKITPPPSWQNLTVRQRQSRFRKGVREIEEMYAQARREEGRPVAGLPKLFALDSRDRPKNPRKSSRQPLCHASSKRTRRNFKKQWSEFVSEYKDASWDYRNGDWEREFPDGSFRPPIKTIYRSSRL